LIFHFDDAPTVSLPGATALASSSTSTFPGSSANGNLYMLRAFIQWGGFTFGKTASFFDFFNTSKYTNQTNELYQDFGGNGIGVPTTAPVAQLTPVGDTHIWSGILRIQYNFYP
jgi:Porin subfamily